MPEVHHREFTQVFSPRFVREFKTGLFGHVAGRPGQKFLRPDLDVEVGVAHARRTSPDAARGTGKLIRAPDDRLDNICGRPCSVYHPSQS